MTDITERLKTTLEGGLDSWPTASIEWEYAEAIKALEAQQAEIASLKNEYQLACGLVASMHLAATGGVMGPKSGIVEDVAELKAERDALAEQVKVLRGALEQAMLQGWAVQDGTVLNICKSALATGDGK